MRVEVEVCLKGDNVATTKVIEGVVRDASVWNEADVRTVLEGMLRAMHDAKHPEASVGAVSLRGLSWIVNDFDEGGVVIAVEVTLGAAIAGPFQIDKASLEAMITRVIARPAEPPLNTVH